MALTIITCVYNGEAHVDSYWREIQTLGPLVENVIVINDGSTDRTLNKLHRIRSEKIKIYSVQNSGPSYARNFGLNVATTPYVLFLDIDDKLLVDGLSTLKQIITDNDNVDFAIGSVRYTKNNGQLTFALSIISFFRRIRFLFIKNSISHKIFYNNYFITPGCIIFKTAFIKRFSFDPDLRLGEDWELFTRILNEGNFRLISYNVLDYRISSNSLSFTASNNKLNFDLISKKLTLSFIKYYPNLDANNYKNSIELNFNLFKIKQSIKRSPLFTITKLHIQLIKRNPKKSISIGVNFIKLFILKISPFV